MNKPVLARMPTKGDRKSTRLNSSHLGISYAVFCLKKKIRVLVDEILPLTLRALPGEGETDAACDVARSAWHQFLHSRSHFFQSASSFFFLFIRRPPSSPLFPNTTLFR